MGDGALARGPDGLGVFPDRAGAEFGRRGYAGLGALRHLRFGKVHVERARHGVDADDVAVAQQADGAALGRLRPDMADAEAARRAGEPSVRDQRHRLAEAAPVDRGGRRQHLAHAGPALGAFIADDDDIARLDAPVDHGVEGVLLAVEAARRALELQHVHARDLHDRAVRGEAALEAHHAARLAERRLHRIDDLLVGREGDVLEVFGHGLAGDRDAVAVQEAVVEQLAQQDRDAAGVVHILGDILPAGLEVTDIGRRAEDLGDLQQVEIDARLMRNSRQVQAGIGGPAGGRDHAGGVFQRLAGDDVARAQTQLDEVHHLPAGLFAIGVARQVGGGRGAGMRKRQPDGLGHGRHGVGGELAAAGPARGAGAFFQLLEVRVGELARRMLADALEDILDGDVLAAEIAGQDRAAVEEDRRHVEAHLRHHHAGQRLVAAGESDQRVVAVAAHGELDGVGDHFPRHQRGLHALVAHGDAVGDGDRRELAGRAVGGLDAGLHRLRLAGEGDVAGRGLVPAGGDADERGVDFLLRHAHGVIEGAVRRLGRPFGDMPARKPAFVEA